jgi:adenine-specific DNA-methyltransferase
LCPELLHLLLSHERLRNNFFVEVDGVTVFDKVKFQKFVMNKRFLPDSYTCFKNKIGLTDADGSNFLSESREIVLSWPFKDCMLEGGQTKEDAKRNEIFWNEILAPDEINRLKEPKVLTNFVRYDSDGEHKVTEVSSNDNFIIKGNNLLALYSLRKKYIGKIKLIYIDPPFNTGNDSFNYNDSFNHSTWLTFMHNRLVCAKELLCKNGVIFIECDKNEMAYLKVLCDDIFGVDNFVSDITVQTSYANGLKVSQKDKTILKMKDTILVYKVGDLSIKPQYTEKRYWDTHYNLIMKKNDSGEMELFPLKEELISLGIIQPKEVIRRDTINQPAFFEYVCANKDAICCLNPVHSDGEAKQAANSSQGKIVKFTSSRGNVQYFYNGRQIGFFNQCFHNVDGEEKISVLLGDIWTDIDFGNNQNEGGVDFPNGKKPEALLARIIDMVTEPGDIVLDYHLGSGSTAAVAHKMGRRYIGIEQMDYIKTLSVKRLINVIAGEQGGISKTIKWNPKQPSFDDSTTNRYANNSFVYCELATANQKFVDAIEASTTTEQLRTIWTDMQATGFLSWKVRPQEVDENISDFTQLSLDDQKRFLIECLDKNLLYVPYSEINNKEFGISEDEKNLNSDFYSIG